MDPQGHQWHVRTKWLEPKYVPWQKNTINLDHQTNSKDMPKIQPIAKVATKEENHPMLEIKEVTWKNINATNMASLVISM